MNEARRQVESVMNQNWSDLWAINAPPKTRHLVWKVCRGCIPTRNRLLQRQVECAAECPL
ncbi:putative reverse transcriptase, partial [Trifolium medium]|nr:putative reverse transcriptase [Trifolium medium]